MTTTNIEKVSDACRMAFDYQNHKLFVHKHEHSQEPGMPEFPGNE